VRVAIKQNKLVLLAIVVILQLALTDMGMVYSWGSGVDGALGHGNMDSITSPRLVEYFGLQQPLFVTQIAAGSDMIGAHSAAIANANAGPAKVMAGSCLLWRYGTEILHFGWPYPI
jgi:hypothetical protein